MDFVPDHPRADSMSARNQCVDRLAKFLPGLSGPNIKNSTRAYTLYLGRLCNEHGERLVIIRKLDFTNTDNLVLSDGDRLLGDIIQPGNLVRDPKVISSLIVDPSPSLDGNGATFRFDVDGDPYFAASRRYAFKGSLDGNDRVKLAEISDHPNWKAEQDQRDEWVRAFLSNASQ
jgi:hypothetical protein